MGHPVLLGALGAGAGVERDQDRHRARALDRDPVQRRARSRGSDGLRDRQAPPRRSKSRLRLACKSPCRGRIRGRSEMGLARLPRTLWLQLNHSIDTRRRRESAAAGADRAPRGSGGRAGFPTAPVGDRVPWRLQALFERRHRPRPGHLLDRARRLRVPRRLDRLGQVDRDASADQGARADRRARSASPAATSARSSASGSPYYRRNIGVVFQDFKLLPSRTVYDNVAYALQVTGGARREIRAKVPDILRLTGLSTKLHNYPDQLSGGEQQRVSIARAFVNHPPLLLADEPTGNLDPETSIDIMRLLYRINRTGTTVLVATHDRRWSTRCAGACSSCRGAGSFATRPPACTRATRRTREFAQRHAPPSTRPPGSVADEDRILPARGAAGDAAQRGAELRGARDRARDDARARGVHPDRAGDQRRREQRPRAGCWSTST